MKLRPSLLGITAALFLAAATGIAQAAEAPAARNADHVALARQLVDLVNPTGVAETQIRMLAEEFRSDPRLAGYGDLFSSWLEETASPDALANQVALMYAEHFTPAELKDILKFYKSATGKKVIAAMPALTAKSMQLGQDWAIERAPLLLEKIRQRREEEMRQQEESMAVPPPLMQQEPEPAPAYTPPDYRL